MYISEVNPLTFVHFLGWFIGMMLAVVFLILCCVVVCLIKRNRGGKYAVQESEERQGRRDPYDDGGFPEYTQP